ncbi:hypothetical protein A3SI_19286 [Nitritalea halalkaliphila LW7]|uniref:Uncharacterized protein n=1 Tax=Nitritalea halalkaliphila LW7 TaxID=1189621 RepID=I5BTF5_9BACT|nr:hypothetical protein [Nitritalea halalkaliphila]EIM72857.1 hypothetical protein A3SI_19286 [Nitritalea halalkaliphila LW7]
MNMHSVYSFCIGIVLMLSLFRLTLIQVHFHWNQEAIAELFCINKDIPESGCDGTCELGKRLAEAKGEGEKSSLPQVDEKTPTLYVLQAAILLFAQEGTGHLSHPIPAPMALPQAPIFGIFQPPRA